MDNYDAVAAALKKELIPNPKLRILSLGAGVQSSTLALLAASGIIEMPDFAIFADTQSEPKAVYKHLAWLEKKLPFPVYHSSIGSLNNEILSAMRGERRMDARPPFYTNKGSVLNRQCTHRYKILPIQKKIRELIGLKKGQRAPIVPVVEQWIGISTDESIRMKPNQLRFIQNRWPLIELGMSRKDCLAWNKKQGNPKPPKSACTFCPYMDDARWDDMKTNDPESFRDACLVDEAIRPGMPGPNRPDDEQWFIHRSRQPLALVDFKKPKYKSLFPEFTDECEGMCGN